MTLMENPDFNIKLLTPPKLAHALGIDASVVRAHYKEFGGFKLSTRLYFTEEGVKHALQEQTGQCKSQSIDRSGDHSITKRTTQNIQSPSPSMRGRGLKQIF